MASTTKVISLGLPAQAIPRKSNRSTMAFLTPEESLDGPQGCPGPFRSRLVHDLVCLTNMACGLLKSAVSN